MPVRPLPKRRKLAPDPAAAAAAVDSSADPSQRPAPRPAACWAAAAEIPPFPTRRTRTSSNAETKQKQKPKSKPKKSARSEPPPATEQPASQPSASQHEDIDDLIEDAFSDDDRIASQPVIRRQRGIPSHCDPASSSGQTQSRPVRGGRLELRGPSFPPATATATATATARPRPRPTPSDPRPWPERFAPASVAALAVHPRKVAEVRSWLEHVLDGFSRQRLLVLKGSAGTGKTATITALAAEVGFEVLEWKNPSSSARGVGAAYGEEEAFSAGLAGMFEEFVSRAGSFGSLEMVAVSKAAEKKTPPESNGDGGKKKVILIEDFPNALFTSSQTPLESFRHAIKSFLSMPPPPRSAPPIPPLVLIISESAAVTGPGAFTAHRLLSPEILHHPLAATISFNKIAHTFMMKALTAAVSQESRESGRKLAPGKMFLESLTPSGDIRSAIMGLEFFSVKGEFGAPVTALKKEKKLNNNSNSGSDAALSVSITQRESQLGIFHAIGKVIYNKRYGDDPDDPYIPPPPRPLLDTHAYHRRTSKLDPGALLDTSSTDPQTLISGIHENYLPSINTLGGLSRGTTEDLLDCVNACLAELSDSDLLATPRPYHTTLSSWVGRGNYDAGDTAVGTAGIRVDEISFQVAVRGLSLALPSPVKREGRDNKVFYPTALKIWRDREEIEGVVDLFVGQLRMPDACGAGRSEMVLERLPYLKTIMKAQQQQQQQQRSRSGYKASVLARSAADTIKRLEKVTLLRGIARQSEDLPDDEDGDAALGELEAAEERSSTARLSRDERAKIAWNRRMKAEEEQREIDAVEESKVLVEDDIVDDW